jgi:5-methylcytosine-specific restriction endonuclease McrA
MAVTINGRTFNREPISVKSNGAWATTNCLCCCGIFQFKVSQLSKYPRAGSFCSKECSEEGSYRNCVICKVDFRSYNDAAIYCSEPCRRMSQTLTPLDKKIRSISANLLLGRGRKEIVRQLIVDALNTPCTYCGVTLTLDNLSLDHKEAYGSVANRRQKAANQELRRHTDRLENIHIICRDCNSRKSDFNHDEYVELLAWLEERPEVKKKLFKRLAQAKFVWMGRRK